MDCPKVAAVVRKAKKKQVKDELDRIKQTEKKKRRLEKALATSAAIRSELEKKKQKKKEEQDRLDEEGAAIAEAVALHVLLGEDSDESTEIIMQRKDEELTSWDHARNVLVARHAMVPCHDLAKCSLENLEQISNTQTYGPLCNHWGHSWVTSNALREEIYPRCSEMEIAAQAVSSLKIADDALADAYLYNGWLRG